MLTGDLIRFIATVDAGDKAIEDGATVSFFDGDTFLGTAPVDSATGQAVFDHRFAERGEHQVRAVFNGQEQKNEDGVTTDVLEPSESDPVVLDVQAHEVVIEEPEPQDARARRIRRTPRIPRCRRPTRAPVPVPGTARAAREAPAPRTCWPPSSVRWLRWASSPSPCWTCWAGT